MQFQTFKNSLRQGATAAFLLLSGVVASGQGVMLNLTANRTVVTLADGNPVPMWGLTCDTVGPNCAPLNTSTGWAPPVITVPAGTNLTIALTNNLPVPTSLTILGQLGGGVGTPVKVPSPTHALTPTTWAVAGDASG